MSAAKVDRRGDGRAIWSWCLYDFANSPFTTLVVTFIYASYFAQEMAASRFAAELGLDLSDPQQRDQAVALGTDLWSNGVALSAVAVALLSPLLGAFADRGGFRKAFLLTSTLVAAAGTVGLYFIEADRVLLALAVFVVANVAFEMGMVFYNAFLPDIAPAERIGRISGYGWGLGYAGGLLALVVALVTLVLPEQPWFGLSGDDSESARATNLLVAGWFLIFSVPIFLWVKEDKSRITVGESLGGLVRRSYDQLRVTFREIGRYRQVVRFLLARLIYNDGLVTVFAFGGIYAAGTFCFDLERLLVFGIVLNVAAGTGAALMGRLDDRIGAKKTIAISLCGLLVATLLAVLAPVLFPLGDAGGASGEGGEEPCVSPQATALFWIAGVLIGVFAGPNQSASRSLMGRLVPPDKENEFFGFFAFSGKATAFLGPLLLGAVAARFQSQSAGVAVVLLFFVVGLWLLSRIDEAEGIAAAARDVAPPSEPAPSRETAP